MLITSLITQNRNIPAIQRSVELLSEMCGEKYTDFRGRVYYSFALPSRLMKLGEKEMKACRLGYRRKYVQSAALVEGWIDLQRLMRRDCEEAVSELCALYGIGNKVASCVALFGLHQHSGTG